MNDTVTHSLLWTAAVSAGVMAGVYFAFSTFVMSALARLPQSAGVSAMQSINKTILSSPFMPLFFGSTLLSLGAIGLGVWHWGAPGSMFMAVGGAVYVVGMFVCTAAFNVPLNNALWMVGPQSAEAAPLWSTYLHDWTLWNHVRTIASTIACALFIAALLAQ